MISVLAGLALAVVSPVADKWDIKPFYVKDKSAKMAVELDVDMGGATLGVTLVSMVAVKDKTDKLIKGELSWDDIQLDGQPIGEGFSAPLELAGNGRIVHIESDLGEDLRRQVMPLFFVYPDKAVGPGDKWVSESKKDPAGKDYSLKQDYEVVAQEKFEDLETLKVKVAYAEPGDGDRMSVSGHFWIAKDGRPLKAELDVKNWPIPQQGGSANVKIRARLQK